MAYLILSIIVAVAALALVLWAGVLLRNIVAAQPSDIPAPAPVPYDDGPLWEMVHAVNNALSELQKGHVDLTAAVAHGIDHVDRNEKRVRGIVTGALRRFEAEGYEDPGVGAEADSLPIDDAGGSRIQPLPAVPNDVDPDYVAAWATVPGDTSEMTES